MEEEEGETRSYDYLLQRISVALHQGNAVKVLGTSIPRNNFNILTF